MAFEGNLKRTIYFFFSFTQDSVSVYFHSRVMPGGRISSPLSARAGMSWVACGDFLPLEFTILFLLFLAGLASNLLFVLISFKEVVDAKGCFEKPNPHLVHWSIANLIILVCYMPLDILSFTSSGSWFLGLFLCR